MVPDFEQISRFWREVADTIDSLMTETDEWRAQELLEHYERSLKRIDQNLTFHFERDERTEQVEMVFGCDGYAQSISSVLSLVTAAPPIEGVQVIAFHGRVDPLPEVVQVAEFHFPLDSFWFSYRLRDGAFHLSVYIEDMSHFDQSAEVEAVMIYLDAILGEYDLMTRVATLNWYERPADPEDYGLRPLAELRRTFDSVRDQIKLIGVTLH